MVVSGCLHYWMITSVLLLSSWRQCNGTTMTFTTSPADLPVMPVITDVSANSTSIIINWNQNLSSDVFWYELRYNFTIKECYSENNTWSNEWIDNMINGSLTSYTLTNSSETPVEEDSAYSVFLTAVNSDGRSKASTTEISTLGAVPTGAPINLNGMVVNDREITIQWEPVECSQRNGEIIGYNVIYHPAGDNSMPKSVVIHASDSTFTATGLVFDTVYAFEVQAINSYGIGPPANANVQTSTLQGIVIVYDGQSHQNNSIVNLDAKGGVLQCFTNKMGCCNVVMNRQGEWRNSNGSQVQIRGRNGDFYRTRGKDPGVVNLTWTENAMIPEGVFCCEITKIPPSQFACIGVYPEGAGFPMVVSITVDPSTALPALVCTSTGGPATTVIWKVNNQIINEGLYQQRQRIASHQNATFQNILRIPRNSIANYDATYECIVINSVGNDSLSFRLEAIEIVSENLSVGENGSLSCKSIIDVEVMEWLNSNGEVIASLTDARRLNLTFAPVNTSINNQMYTCRVNHRASVNKTITVSVAVEDPLEVMIGGPSSVVVIGEGATINCTATTIVGVSQLPTLTLTHPNGTNLSRTEGKMASIILDPVEVEDAGEYTCTGEINLENITSATVQDKQNFTFKLSTPTINVAYDKNILKVGSSTVLNCTVTNYSIANFDVSINITWSRSGIVLSNDSDRVVISSLDESSLTSTSRLTLSPLSASDENITCSVILLPATLNSFIEMSPIVSKHVQLNIENPDIMVQITSTADGHNLTTGSNVSLTCTVDGTTQLKPELNFEWVHSNGFDQFETVRTNSNRLNFPLLKLSDAGEYMCTVNISSSLLNANLSMDSISYAIRIFAPLPSVSAIPPSQAVFNGSSFNITCVVEFNDTVDVPLIINIMLATSKNAIDDDYAVNMESRTRYTRTFTIENFQYNEEYICTFLPPFSELLPLYILTYDMATDQVYALVNVMITASLEINIASSGENMAGENYNLSCTAVINGSFDVPNIVWNSTVYAETISYDNGTYISILQFDPLQESHRDHYQCSVAVADIVKEMSFYFNVQVPTVYATVSSSEGAPVVGQPYTLSCSVSGDEMLESSVTYQWMKYEESGMETPLETVSEILSFSSLNLSNSGNYSCSAVISSIYLDNSISANSNLVSIILQAPPPSSVMIMSLTDDIFAGIEFSVACTVSLPPTVDIAMNVNIEWSEPAGATSNYTSSMITDNPNEYISIADVVSNIQSERINFQCAANVDSDSPFITASESRATNISIFVVGRPSQPTGLSTSVGSTNVELTWSTRDGDIVYGYELQYNYHIRQCPSNVLGMIRSIDISNSTSHTLENLEEDSGFNISLTAFNPAGRSEPANVLATTLTSVPSGAPQDLNITHFDFTNVTIEWNPVECSQRNGEIDGYRLIYYPTMDSGDNESILIDGSNTNHFTIVGLQPRVEYTLTLGAVGGNSTLFGVNNSTSISTLTPQVVGFLFNSQVYGNNSIVSLTEIGEGRNSLLCITNNDECCEGRNPISTRHWYFPNGIQVGINGMGDSIYRDRGLSIVRLNRRHNTTSPTGVFRCTIPSSTGSINNIYIGIYHDGQGAPSITSFTFSRSSISLNCMSTGGPVTRVIWRLNNQPLMIDGTRYQQIQIIIDTENATYRNMLQSDDNRNLVGVFTCIVQNARGSDSMTISTNGVVINNTAEAYMVGINITITCRSDTATERMEWLRNETVIVSGTMTMQLDLDFTPVNDSVHGHVYICRVTRNTDETTEQNFTMNVTVPAANRVLNLNIVPMRNTGVAGESISFMCIVTKTISGLEHQPLAVWVENGAVLTEQSESNVILAFNKLNTSHGKVYTCRGTISSPALGTPLVVMENHSLIVQISTPSINVTLSSSTVYAGTNLSIICDISINTAVDSDISVNVTWFNGTTPISTEIERVSMLPLAGTTPSFSSNLLIHPLIDVDDTFNFSCQASVHSDSAFIQQSNVGEGSIHIPVQQRTPSKPKIMIENITSTEIDLRWSQEAHDFIKGFTITATYMAPCNDFSNTTSNGSSHSALTRQANIAGLQEFSSYSIVITAFNDAGNSSSQKTITTNSSEPAGSPKNIRNISVNLTSIIISWSPISCIEQNSIIHVYNIVYYQKRLQEGTRNNISTMMTNVTINNLDPRTNYEFEVQGINENGQKGPSEKLNVTTSAPTAVGLLFHDSHNGNKSVVSLDEIGEGADALLCLTNSLSCCEENGDDGTTGGVWYFPDSSPVPLESQASGHNMYITRGPGVVRLHRRGGSMMPAGIFRCEIPDEGGMNQSIYIGVYPDVLGEGAVEVQNLRFDKGKQALSCTSTGGPPTTVTWTKNGERLNIDGSTHNQTQIITDASSSIFVTTLFINYRPDLNEIVGNYSCLIDNSRVTNVGTNLRTFEIEGLKIVGHESSLPHGSSVHLNCSTDLATDTIEWLDAREKVLRTGNGFSLQLTDTPSGVTNVVYICRINSRFGSQNKTANVHILSPSDSDSLTNDLLLQLRLFEVQNCLEWVNVNTNIKVNDISTAIVSHINQQCLCGLSRENVTNGVFRCFPASPRAVTFRAILHGGTTASSSELSSYIEQWIENDITIPIQSILINVDSSCMIAISSFDDGECQIDSEKHTNNSSSAIIGGTVAGLLLLLILSSAVVIALLIMLLRRKKHHGRDSNTRMQMTEANLTHSPAHDYEAIDKYTKEYKDVVEMDLTKCPAYEPIKQT